MLPVLEAERTGALAPPPINPAVTTQWLEAFLRDELRGRRGVGRAVIGLSGGVDSAVTAFLCARALGPENVHAFRLPYASSSKASLDDAQLVVDALGIHCRTIEITAAVDGYLQFEPEADPRRRGNVMARTRMLVLFDQSAKIDALPIGTGNKTERMLGYFTWHADDTLIAKAPSADLEAEQTDEGDLGISYARADAILAQLLLGYSDAQLVEYGFAPEDVALVRRRVDSTHWKRHLPTTAMLSNTAINEFYLRPVDF